MNKPPDKYKCVKKQLKDVFKNQDDVEKINELVKRSNQINIKTYMLLKLYILNEYENLVHVNNELTLLPDITVETIEMIRQSFITKTSGRKTVDPEKISFIDKIKGIKDTIDNFSNVKGLHLSGVLDYQTTEIKTAIENNIREHFLFEYINRFVNVVFKLKNSMNPDIRKELMLVKNDLRNGTLTCNFKYHSWLKKYRFFVVPRKIEKSYHYDVKTYPQKYLVHMIWINKMLDAYGSKKYNFLPQRTDIITKYSQLDTKTIIELFLPDKLYYLKNLSNEQDNIWNTVSSIKRKYNKDYSFDFCILTDGHACSIRYVEKTQQEKNSISKEYKRKGRENRKNMTAEEKENKDRCKEEKKENEKQRIIEVRKEVIITEKNERKKRESSDGKKEEKKDKYIEFPYIEETDSNFLLSIKNPVFIDPGKGNFITSLKSDDTVYKYTNKKHIRYTKRKTHQKKLERLKETLGIIKVETELSDYNSKSVSISDYTSYCVKKLEINERLENLYSNKKFRQYKFYNYICRERRYSKMLDELEKEFGSDAVLIYGDASIGVSMRNFISTPNITIKRKLQQRFKVLSIDEFRTSCINCHTLERQREHFKYKDAVNKTRSLHSVLTYKMENNRLGCINRDLNAVRNIKYIYNYYLDYLRGINTDKRPFIFSRENKNL